MPTRETSKVHELELELKNIRTAFEEYIASSRELEDGLDRELTDMHGKLAHSTATNEALTAQLETMEPLLNKLEKSLEDSKLKLKEEQKLRRHAELAQVEMEAKYQKAESKLIELRDENVALRQECDAANEELAFKTEELEESKAEQQKHRSQMEELRSRLGAAARHGRSTHSSVGAVRASASTVGEGTAASVSGQTQSSSRVDDSYVEILDELETVTEQFIATQQKLWRTEDKLRESETKIRMLDAQLAEKDEVSEETQHALKEYQEENTFRAAEERKLREELDSIKRELSLAHDELYIPSNLEANTNTKEATKDNSSGLLHEKIREQREMIENLHAELSMLNSNDFLSRDELAGYTDEIMEAQEAIARYVEEVSRLEKSLQQERSANEKNIKSLKEAESKLECKAIEMEQAVKEAKEKMVKQVRSEMKAERDKEINVLREKFKQLFKENAVLQQKVAAAETSMKDARGAKEGVPKLKEEVKRLTTILKSTKEAHIANMAELEKISQNERDRSVANARKEMAEEREKIIDHYSKQLMTASREKQALIEKVDDCEKALTRTRRENDRAHEQWRTSEVNLKASRDEILKLKKKIHRLTSNQGISQPKSDRAIVAADMQDSSGTIDQFSSKLSSNSNVDGHDEYNATTAKSENVDDIVSSHLQEKQELEEKLKQMAEELSFLRNSVSARTTGHNEAENVDNSHPREIAQTTGSATTAINIQPYEKHIESLRRELQECHLALEKTQLENRDLQDKADQLQKSQKSEERGRALFDRIFGRNRREGRDPDGGDGVCGNECNGAIKSRKSDGVNTTRQVRGRNVRVSFADDNRETRDPPTNSSRAGDDASTGQEEGIPSTIEDIMPHFNELTKENKTLKKRVFDLSITEERLSKEVEVLRGELEKSTTQIEQHKQALASHTNSLGIGTKIVSDGTDGEEDRDDTVEERGNPGLSPQIFSSQRENERKVLNQQFSSLLQENKDISQKLEEAESELQQVKEEVDSLKQAHEKLEEKATEDAEKLKKSERKLQDIEEQLTKAHQKLDASSAELKASKNTTASLQDENKRLVNDKEEQQKQHLEAIKKIEVEAEARGRKAADAEIRSKVSSERDSEFHLLHQQIRKLTEEKSTLQHQIDDNKIALSVSQYAQERNKEELRSCQSMLLVSQKEVDGLQYEVNSLRNALASTKKDHDNTVNELATAKIRLEEARTKAQVFIKDEFEMNGLARQVDLLIQEKSLMAEKLKESEKVHSTSQQELTKTVQHLASLENNLYSSREETRLLTEEITRLSSALEKASVEYDAVVDELEAVNELFDEARQEAERCGRQAAAEEVRKEMKAAREKERQLVKDQLRKIFEENAILQRKVDEAEMSLVVARSSKSRTNEEQLAQKEVSILKEALKSATEEARTYKERTFALNVDLNSTRTDLENVQSELKKANQRLQIAMDETKKVPLVGSASTKQRAREFLLPGSTGGSGDIVDDAGTKSQATEGIMLKMEMNELSKALDKALKDNSQLEEELKLLKKSIQEVKEEAESHGRVMAQKDARAEMAREREHELREFKDQFNDLMEENSKLLGQIKSAGITLAQSKETQDRNADELKFLESKVCLSKEETRSLQEQVFNLNIELQKAKDDHDKAIKMLRESLSTENQEHIKLQRKIDELSLENSTLLHGKDTTNTHLTAVSQKLSEIESALSQATNERDMKEKENEQLRSHLQISLQENAKNQVKINELESALEQAKATAKETTSKLERAAALGGGGGGGSFRSRDLSSTMEDGSRGYELGSPSAELLALKKQLSTLSHEKAALQNEVDNVKISLSVSQYSQERHKQDLKSCKASLEEVKTEYEKVKQELIDCTSALEKEKRLLSSTKNELLLIDQILANTHNGRKAPPKDPSTRFDDHYLCAKCMSTALNDGNPATTIQCDREGTAAAAPTTTAAEAERCLGVHTRVNIVVTELQALRKQHDDTIIDLRAMESKVNEVRKEAEASGRAAVRMDWDKQKSERDKEVRELREQLQGFFTENLSLQSKIESNDVALATERDEHSKCQEKLSQSTEKVSQLEEELTDVKVTLHKTKGENERLTDKLDKVQKECAEAEEKGRASAVSKLRSELKSVREQEREEVLNQFQKFFEENDALHSQLEESASKLRQAHDDAKTKEEVLVKKIEDLTTRIKEKETAYKELDATNKKLEAELQSCKDDLDVATQSHLRALRDLEQVQEKLAQVEKEIHERKNIDATKGNIGQQQQQQDVKSYRTTSADVTMLQDQVKKLSTVSVALEQKVEQAEQAALLAHDAQLKNKEIVEARAEMSRKLQEQLERATEDRSKQEKEIEDLAAILKSRVSRAENNVSKLEKEMVLAKGSLQLSEAGLAILRTKVTQPKKSATTTTTATTRRGFATASERNYLPRVMPSSFDEISEDPSAFVSSSGCSPDDCSSSMATSTRSLKKKRSRSSSPVLQRHRSYNPVFSHPLGLELRADQSRDFLLYNAGTQRGMVGELAIHKQLQQQQEQQQRFGKQPKRSNFQSSAFWGLKRQNTGKRGSNDNDNSNYNTAGRLEGIGSEFGGGAIKFQNLHEKASKAAKRK